MGALLLIAYVGLGLFNCFVISYQNATPMIRRSEAPWEPEAYIGAIIVAPYFTAVVLGKLARTLPKFKIEFKREG